MKLIFKSKILEDDSKTLDDYAVTEGSAIVVMVQKVCFSRFSNLFRQSRRRHPVRRQNKKSRLSQL